MRVWSQLLHDWWAALLNPEAAGRLVLNLDGRRGVIRFLVCVVVISYALYGFSMGLFRGLYAGAMSGFKLPFVYMLTVCVCFPPFYVINQLHGPQFRPAQCLRMFLLAVSVNAVALTSYALFSFFFTLTTSREGYDFLALMHVVVFGLAGMLSLVEIGIVVRSAAAAAGRNIRPAVLLAWGALYGMVGSQMAWLLRPWIGSWAIPYAPFRPIESSFIQAVWRLIF